MGPRTVATLLAAALLAGAAGCGSKDPELSPVRGTVSYKGVPLGGGTVVFIPDPDRGGSGPIALAEIQADGTFVLKTDDKPGAAPGWHRVTVAASPPAGEGGTRLPPRFSDPELSGQCHEVKPGRANAIDLRLD
jgi:hypothetical protein